MYKNIGKNCTWADLYYQMQYVKENDIFFSFIWKNCGYLLIFVTSEINSYWIMMTDIKINVINIFCKMFHDDFIWIQYYLDISKNWAQIFYNSKYSPFSDKKSNVWHNVKLHKMCLRVIQFNFSVTYHFNIVVNVLTKSKAVSLIWMRNMVNNNRKSSIIHAVKSCRIWSSWLRGS